MSYEEIDESTLTPEELAGKREVDAIAEHFAPLWEEAKREEERDPGSRAYDLLVYDRDRAEDDLLERSVNAQAYLRRIVAKLPNSPARSIEEMEEL